MAVYWNPRRYLNIGAQGHENKCDGITQRGLRCKNSVGPDTHHVAILLDQLSRMNITITGRDREVDDILEKVAKLTLCKRWHRTGHNSQVRVLVLEWSQIINSFIAEAQLLPRRNNIPQPVNTLSRSSRAQSIQYQHHEPSAAVSQTPRTQDSPPVQQHTSEHPPPQINSQSMTLLAANATTYLLGAIAAASRNPEVPRATVIDTVSDFHPASAISQPLTTRAFSPVEEIASLTNELSIDSSPLDTRPSPTASSSSSTPITTTTSSSSSSSSNPPPSSNTRNALRQSYHHPRKPLSQDPCYICDEDFESSYTQHAITYCRHCGTNVHRECNREWLADKRGSARTCGFCRGRWGW